MLQRLALVVWWFGSIVWGLTALGCCYEEGVQLIEQHRCVPILSEYANWEHRYDNAKAKYDADHKKAMTGQTVTANSNEAAFDELIAEDELEKLVPKRSGLDDDHKRCQVAVDRTYWLALLVASALTLFAFSMAYVVGGRFWLPPKIP
jgi:hypothetical protein